MKISCRTCLKENTRNCVFPDQFFVNMSICSGYEELKKEVKKPMENELKRRVEKIRKDRKDIIKKIISTLESDTIFLNDNYRLKDDFCGWMIQTKLIEKDKITLQKIYKKDKYKKTIKYKKRTPEFIIIQALKFKHNKSKSYIYYDNPTYDHKKYDCPYNKRDSFYLLDLSGDIWIKYEMILKTILKAIPLYQEYFYQAELLRLCDKKYTYICEKCGSKNEKCAVYCNMCGGKLHEN